jgi:hypothetical protein
MHLRRGSRFWQMAPVPTDSVWTNRLGGAIRMPLR